MADLAARRALLVRSHRGGAVAEAGRRVAERRRRLGRRQAETTTASGSMRRLTGDTHRGFRHEEGGLRRPAGEVRSQVATELWRVEAVKGCGTSCCSKHWWR